MWDYADKNKKFWNIVLLRMLGRSKFEGLLSNLLEWQVFTKYLTKTKKYLINTIYEQTNSQCAKYSLLFTLFFIQIRISCNGMLKCKKMLKIDFALFFSLVCLFADGVH